MLVNKEKCKFGIGDILLIIAAAILLIGINSFFAVCEAMEMVMSCHWAGEVIKGIAILLLVLAILHFCIPSNGIKQGLDIAFIGISVLLLRVPGGIIDLCKMDDMDCRAKTQPAVLVISIVIIVIALIDLFINLSAQSKERHSR